FDIVPPDLHPPDKDRDQNAISTRERFAPVLCCGNARGILPGFDDPQRGATRRAQSLRIDIHEGNMAVPERRESEDVPDEFPSDLEATRADECDLLHDLC